MFSFTEKSKNDATFSADSFSYWLLLTLAAILPLAVTFSTTVPTTITKIAVGGGLTLLTFVFFAIARMRRQELSLPKSLLLASAWLIPLAYLLSTLFASSGSLSIFGERLQMDSTAFMALVMMVLTLTALIVDTTKRALGVYLAMLASAAMLTIFELLIFFAREGVAATGITLQSLSLIGSLNDLAVFFGLIVVFVLLSLILLPVSAIIRGILWLSLLASGFFLAVVNLTILWWVIGIFTLGAFVYSVSLPFFTETTNSLWRGQVESLAVLMLCASFLFGSTAFTEGPAKWASVGELEVRPAWKTTASIGSQALDGTMLFGTGPGSFSHVWAQHMPVEINRTSFWQTDFTYGIGLVPTSVITTGILGTLAWIVFLVLFLLTGFRGLLLSKNTQRGDIIHYLRVTSFLSAAYLWMIAVIQVPSPVLVMYAALLTGVFIAGLGFGSDAVRMVRLQFRENPRVGFAVTLILTFVILLCVGGLYNITTQYYAEKAYQNAVELINNDGDIDGAEELVKKRAVRLNPTDTYYRLLSAISVVRLQQLFAENKAPEEIKTRFEAYLGQAITDAQEATLLDPTDYQNWLNLGTVYQSIVPVGVEGASENANAAYDRVLALRPNSPFIHLSKAALSRVAGRNEEARALVEQALSLRGQYTDAIFFLAQMQLEENDVASAVRSVESVTIFEPNNPVAFFQLGLLQYGSENYVASAQAFERAVALNPVYANAHYFLGLTYWRLGNNTRAVAEFESVLDTNPNNPEVLTIIDNLSAGRDPFATLSASPEIEEIEELPVEDEEGEEKNTTSVESKELAE